MGSGHGDRNQPINPTTADPWSRVRLQWGPVTGTGISSSAPAWMSTRESLLQWGPVTGTGIRARTKRAL